MAWFTFDPVLSGGAGSGLIFSKNNATVSVEGWEHRVALGSVGFSRGIHYWEFTIDNYTADTDPAFGVARIDVARNKMLGELTTCYSSLAIVRCRQWVTGCIWNSIKNSEQAAQREQQEKTFHTETLFAKRGRPEVKICTTNRFWRWQKIQHVCGKFTANRWEFKGGSRAGCDGARGVTLKTLPFCRLAMRSQ